jgi:hypothetical protein
MRDTTWRLLATVAAILVSTATSHLFAEPGPTSNRTIVNMSGGLDPGSPALQPESRTVYAGGDVSLQIRADGTATISSIALREGTRDSGAVRWESTAAFTPGPGKGSIFSVSGTGTVTETRVGKPATTREGTWFATLDDEGRYRLSATGVGASLLVDRDVGGGADMLQGQYIAFFDQLRENGNRSLSHMFRLEQRLGGNALTCVKALCESKKPIMTKPTPANADRFVSSDLVTLAMAYLRKGADGDGQTGYEQGEYILRTILKTPMYKWGVRGGAVVWNDEKAREIAEQLVPEFFNESGREGHADPVIKLLGQ